jgi:hypothetical protein
MYQAWAIPEYSLKKKFFEKKKKDTTAAVKLI